MDSEIFISSSSEDYKPEDLILKWANKPNTVLKSKAYKNMNTGLVSLAIFVEDSPTEIIEIFLKK